MALRTTPSAETWETIYQAFSEVSFVSYDFDTIKQSLLDYLKLYYPEAFNDLIESSELIALLELFAYTAEQLAYRVDMVGHENFITTAQRKQSILRLAKLISYKATRNVPVRGLVKLTSVTTTEQVVDSRGINLADLTINWNDPNNPNWKEQFFLVMNRVLSTRFGQPQKTFQIGDVVMDLYSMNNDPAGFVNGVVPFSVSTGLDSFPFEFVPVDLDENGPFEREPDITSSFSILYSNDGIGDGSDYTGFLAFIKQGTLTRIDYDIENPLPDRRIDFLPFNVNATDVWVQKVGDDDSVIERWEQVGSLAEQNLTFNSDRSTRNKYEVDTLENDQISIIFGDGDFTAVPVGAFRFWMRQSVGRSIVIQKNRIVDESFNFNYTAQNGIAQSATFTFSLTTTLQNGSATETPEHIRRSAPATYYAQNRMVNGQDYNTFMLKDPTILRLAAINRTFAGQPKYIDWNDASGTYENVKLFGDDLFMRYTLGITSQNVSVSGRALIDDVIEPILSTTGIINTLLHISANLPETQGVVSLPRRRFIEDNRGIYDSTVTVRGTVYDGTLKEKTVMQGMIDRHWYGEPLSTVQVGLSVLGVIPDPVLNPKDDSRIYPENLPRTIDGVNAFPPGDIGSGLQPIADQEYFGLRYNRFMRAIGDGTIDLTASSAAWVPAQTGEVWTIELQADGLTFDVRSNLRGSFPTGTVGVPYFIQPTGFAVPYEMFTITAGATDFEQGDTFVLDTVAGGLALRTNSLSIPGNGATFSLIGFWQTIGTNELGLNFFDTGRPPDGSEQRLIVTDSTDLDRDSWLILVRKVRDPISTTVIGYEIYYRSTDLVIESPTTRFWFNEVDQLIDSETQKRVFDNIKVLRSNLNALGTVIGRSQVYDVVGAVRDSNGEINFNQLRVVPSDLLNEDDSGDLIPDRVLQFETFAAGSYEYYYVATPETSIDYTDVVAESATSVTIAGSPDVTYLFNAASFTSNDGILSRRLRMPRLSNTEDGLDFMWQHFSPFTNLIDPSVTNIHDVYILTRGYYDNVINYVRGLSTVAPTAPTPLDLRSSYGYLLDTKMLSDTVVLHSGKIKLLFGSLAEPQLRARWKIVKRSGGTLTNERIKEEVLNVINTFFDIDRWDFGDTFYATELITLIHQRMPADVASVVLVPVYSTNSFGSLFTVEAGHDEVLQSAAELGDIEIVEALTPTVIRQVT